MAVRGVVRGEFVRKRIERAFVIILFFYLALIARLVYLQGVEGVALRAQAVHQREQKIALRAHRGSICDRYGKLLAVSLYSGKVGFDPAALLSENQTSAQKTKLQQSLNDSIHRAAGILGMPEARMRAIVENAIAHFDPKKPKRFTVVARAVPLEVAQRVKNAHPRLLGFGVEDGSRRYYASGENAAHVVGFLGPKGAGAAGLERSCRNWLIGNDGYALAEVDDRRRELPDTLQRIQLAHDGEDVITTLDANAQQIVTEEARHIIEQHHPKGVSIVVVDPMNGDALALVSMPNFDPNPGQSKTLTPDHLQERCAASLYEPGSTLKALTIAAALDDGVINTRSGFYCSGSLVVGGHTIHCVLHGAGERYGHGHETPEDILRHSCNIGAAQIGMRMGPERLYAYEKRFGLLDPLHIGLPAEQHGRLRFDKHENIYTAGKVARVAFGHSITTTPLHVAMAYATFANGGILMQPRLVSAVKDSNGRVVKTWAPRAIRRVISTQTSRTMLHMLRSVVSNGTGKVAAIPGYEVAGKTGTANKYKRGKYVGSFIGIVPASPNARPRAVILVAVDEPQGAYYGAEVAAPAFQAIASRLLEFWHVPEDDPQQTQARTAAANLRHAGHTTIPFALRKATD